MRAISVKIRPGKDKRWYCIIASSNGNVMWVTPRGYARTHHAMKAVKALLRTFSVGRFSITIGKSTRRDAETIQEGQLARRMA